ncbi:MAG: glycosyltransferase [Micropepsaceae bacterium]
MWTKKVSAPQVRPPQVVRGYLDGIVGRRAVGWLLEGSDISQIPVVEVIINGLVVAEGTASHFRQDLLDAGIGLGHHGFDILLPNSLFDGHPRQVFARSKKQGHVLQGSPKTLNSPLATAADAMKLQQSVVESLSVLETRISVLEQNSQRQTELLTEILSRLPGVSNAPIPVQAPTDRGAQFDNCVQHKFDAGDIIIFSIIDWNFRIQRPQHLASRLAQQGYRVIYVSVTLGNLPNSWNSRFEIYASLAPGVFEARLKVAGAPPSVYSGFSEPKNLKEAILAVDDLVKTLDLRRPHVILQYPSWFPVAQSIPGAHLVYDCLDHIAGFSNVSPEIARLERDLIKRADTVVTSSAYLLDLVERERPASIVRNGCEYERFSTSPSELLITSTKPVVGYYGAIAEWFDVELVEQLAIRHPEWDFVLVGATAGSDVESLKLLSNVKLTGEVPYSDLTKYLYAFQVCMIPFKLVELIKATNPVKLYEYLAAGKPVVCSDLPEVRLVPQDLVYTCTDASEFETAIAAALSESDQGQIQRRKEWASENSWDSRALAYTNILNSTPRVSVIVLTYNGLTFNQACLYSLKNFSDYPNLEIICVDNASSDGTVDYLKEWAVENPQHRVILNSENLGFAGGNNVGIEAATGEVIVLLNNDTFVTRGWIQDLVRPLLTDKSIGLAGPVTNMIGGVQKVSLHYSNMSEMAERSRDFTMLRKGELYSTDAVAFFCVAMTRDVVKKVGLLDTQFGMGFFEDDDYCRRVSEAGFRIVCVDGVFVHHHLSASFNELEHGKKGALFKKNKALFEAKWGKWSPHAYRDEPGFGE